MRSYVDVCTNFRLSSQPSHSREKVHRDLFAIINTSRSQHQQKHRNNNDNNSSNSNSNGDDHNGINNDKAATETTAAQNLIAAPATVAAEVVTPTPHISSGQRYALLRKEPLRTQRSLSGKWQ